MSVPKLFLFSVLTLSVPLAAFAREGHASPCKKIITQCETAGFKVGAHKSTGKGVYVDCLGKVLKGETVAGVTADKADVDACSAMKAKHHAKKK